MAERRSMFERDKAAAVGFSTRELAMGVEKCAKDLDRFPMKLTTWWPSTCHARLRLRPLADKLFRKTWRDFFGKGRCDRATPN
jgi:hypothetical protein